MFLSLLSEVSRDNLFTKESAFWNNLRFSCGGHLLRDKKHPTSYINFIQLKPLYKRQNKSRLKDFDYYFYHRLCNGFSCFLIHQPAPALSFRMKNRMSIWLAPDCKKLPKITPERFRLIISFWVKRGNWLWHSAINMNRQSGLKYKQCFDVCSFYRICNKI